MDSKKKKRTATRGTYLKKGDLVMVIAGGNKEKRPVKGKTGRVLGFSGKTKDRVLVEGLNMIKRHQRATAPGQSSEIVQKEAGIHVSNVLFYAEKLNRPVRLKMKFLEDGRKVRGYLDPKSKDFVQVDA